MSSFVVSEIQLLNNPPDRQRIEIYLSTVDVDMFRFVAIE